MHRSAVFNTRRSRLYRRQVPKAEHWSVAAIAVVLAALVYWVVAQRERFDASERDLPIELLYQERPEITLYNRPLQRWAEPGELRLAGEFDFGNFPPAVRDAAWQPVAPVRRFSADNLYQKINGEAEKFIKQGFVRLDYLLLRAAPDGTEFALELFDQGDLGGSLGVFAEHASGREVDERDGVSFFLTAAGVIGRKGQYFFRAAADRQDEAVSAKAAQLVIAFAALGGDAGTGNGAAEVPEGFALLRDGLGFGEAAIQFQESNVFQYDFAERFWFADPGIDANARLFLHVASDADAARALLDALLEEQAYEYQRLDEDQERVVFRHEFLNTYFVVARAGRYLYGLDNMPSEAGIEEWLARVREQLAEAGGDG